MKQSIFRFSNPTLLDVRFEKNRQFKLGSKAKINLDFQTRINKKGDEHEAVVELTVKIGETSEGCPFVISITEGARFLWGDISDDVADSLLAQNAPALLLGYIRPVVASLTASSSLPAYNIPFIDFTDGTISIDE